MPKENIIVKYYYEPERNMTVPRKMDFGDHKLDMKEKTVGIEYDGADIPKISISNSFENSQNKLSDWKLTAKSDGLTNKFATFGDFHGRLYYKNATKEMDITSDKQIVEEDNKAIKDFPLASIDNSVGVLLDVANSGNVEGEYEGTIFWDFELVP